jgi:hypothetical protein
MINDLTDENYILYAAKAYEKPFAIQAEFDEDLNRILYIKRLLTKYHSTGLLKERLLLNHLIIFYNVFGIEASSKLLWLKLDQKDWQVIKPFLLFLNLLPKQIQGVRGLTIETDTIGLDQKVVEILRALNNDRNKAKDSRQDSQ